MNERRAIRILAITISILSIASWVVADDAQYEWEGVERIVAIGDIHGAYDNFVRILENAKLIDDDQRWIGGKTHLVQNGDIVDRGPHSRKAMDLLMKLRDQAEDDGGMVHVLIGNHEAMNVIGILDLVSPEEYEAFVDRDSRRRNDEIFERYYEQIRRETRDQGKDTPKMSDARRKFDEEYPLGYVEHRRAFMPNGRYGKFIRENKTAIKINGIVFSHGDWSEKFSTMDIAEINEHVSKELGGDEPVQEGLAFDEESPLQYRGLAKTELTPEAQQAMLPTVDRILENLHATRMVVGHTLTAGVIESRFGGKHVSIDTGMLELYRGGHRIALEIVGDALRAIHDGGTIPIPETMYTGDLGSYLDAVAAVDPTNIDVQLQRVDTILAAGAEDKIIPILETLIAAKPEHVPFRYRELLGTSYLERGDTERAEAQFLAYIDGLKTLLDSNPSNVNIANLLARFCLQRGLEIDLADNVISEAVQQAPANYAFRLTHARVQLAKQEFAGAIDALESAGEPPEPFRYDAHYVLGLAHEGLGETEEARAELQRAIEIEPSREEARTALSRLDASQN